MRWQAAAVLITLPAYLIAGLPAHMASGTNKCGNFFGTLLSAARFLKSGRINMASALCAAVGSLTGAFVGTKLNMVMPEEMLSYIMLAVVPVIAVFLAVKRDFGTQDRSGELGERTLLILSAAIGLAVGAYDGFFGPGAGTFLILAFTSICRFDLLTASGNTKVANSASNVASLVTFALAGKVMWSVGDPGSPVRHCGKLCRFRSRPEKQRKDHPPHVLCRAHAAGRPLGLQPVLLNVCSVGCPWKHGGTLRPA